MRYYYLFFLIKINDLTHKMIKIKPEISIIIFDISAQKFIKILLDKMDLKKSKHPRKVISPNKTTICINNFFLDEIIRDK